MRITLHGAAGGEVTGSAYLVETARARVLVDCGLFQGGKRADPLNRAPARPKQRLDAVLLTHGHLDHTGRLPLLTRRGYRAPIFATQATNEMTALILRDSARIQAGDAERRNRKRARAGEPPVDPLYTPEDAEEAIGLLQAVPYREAVEVAPGVSALWAEAGHMLGSASIQLIVAEEGRRRKVVFSGDLGPRSVPILRDFEPFHEADMVFVESTYGAREHRPFADTVEEFAATVRKAVETGGKIIVPTFAVGRAQLITGLLGWMFRTRKVRPFPVFLDSPMAIQATRLYGQHRELFDDGMVRFLREKPLREDLKSLKLCATADESRRINDQPGTCLIMAGAGMCNAGRILHHFKANLWKPETQVLMVGYQAVGTLGRMLVDGADSVTIFGEKIKVAAQIHSLGGFSAHAGQTDLLAWLGALAPARPRVMVTHGEDKARQSLAREIRNRFHLVPGLPAMREAIEL